MLPPISTATRAASATCMVPHTPNQRGALKAGDFAPLEGSQATQAAQTASLRGYAGKPGERLLLPFGDRQFLFVGIEGAGATHPHLAEHAASAYKDLTATHAREVDVLLPAAHPLGLEEATAAIAEGMGMAGYVFNTYRGKDAHQPLKVRLVAPAGAAQASAKKGLARAAEVLAGIALARDLINTPAADAHTDAVAAQAKKTAKDLGAKFRQIRGDQLIKEGYHAIHAVGRAAEHPPSLVVLEHGRPAKGKPTLALVGKGVTFDTGGLDLKPSSAMALMKKDMGGAATVLGAFRAIAGLKLPLHTVAVLGLAENAVAAASYRPGDVLATKLGPTIEVTNTDAEGRIVLADAFALAHEHKPTVMVDFATLTGACRVALGRDLMGLFCDDIALRERLVACAAATGDGLWPLPLHQPYRKLLDSHVADMVNSASGGMAGAITAALFLQEFAGDVAWAHLDCYAWSEGDSPLLPKGGNGVGVRLMVALATQLLESNTAPQKKAPKKK